jgi:hypothetical protein
MKADQLGNFGSLTLPKFGNYQKTNKTLLNNFSFSLKLWMYHTQLTWFEEENLGYKAHFETFSQSTVVFACTLVVR